MSELVLGYPNFHQLFNITCDVNNFAIGSVLSQGPIGEYLSIAYSSRVLNKAKQNYGTTEKELTLIKFRVRRKAKYCT